MASEGLSAPAAVFGRTWWERGRTHARAFVVGRILGNEVVLLRVENVREAPRKLRLLGAGVLPWESGESLGEPLERLLGWGASEPFILASTTPSVAGETVPLNAGASRERLEERSTEVRDTRARLLSARWGARERILETAAHFFDCTIESVRIFLEEVHDSAENSSDRSATIIAGLAQDEALQVPASPPDVPKSQLVLLPLLLGGLLKEREDHVGLLLIEETQLSYGVWSDGVPLLLRSFPLGSAVLVECLVRSLRCSPREARTLLTRAEEGGLSASVTRILTRTLRSLVPLYSGAFSVFGSEMSRRVAGPQHLVVAGNWAAVFSRLFCRPSFVARLSASSVALPRVLFRPDITDSRRVNRGDIEDRQSVRLLEYLADAANLRMLLALRSEAAFRGYARA